MAITSLQNPRVKATARLRESRYRRREGRFAIDGLREIDRAIQGKIEIQTAFYCPDRYIRADEAEAILMQLRTADVELLEVSPAILDKMAFGDRAEGILAVAKMPERSLTSFTLGFSATTGRGSFTSKESPSKEPPAVQANKKSDKKTISSKPPLVGIIERIEKPGNVGAVLRSADGAGLDAVIVADPQTDLFNPNTIRSSLGTIFTQPVFSATTEETLAWLAANHLKIFAARVDGSISYIEADYRTPCAIVLGAESTGLSDAWTEEYVSVETPLQAIRLPMLGLADSLNISATAAVLFYEALRQRKAEKACQTT